MTEVIVAVYDTASAAECAMDDLTVAKVPTAVMRQFVPRSGANEGLLEVPSLSATVGDTAVMVTVDERHTREVVEILAMQAPATMTEAPLKVA